VRLTANEVRCKSLQEFKSPLKSEPSINYRNRRQARCWQIHRSFKDRKAIWTKL